MKNIFFTSDLHFGHKKIIQFCDRPWLSVDEMDQGLIDNWNEIVADGDIVYILGDMFFCGSTRAKEILSKLNGQKILILGNHDWKRINQNKASEMGFIVTCNFHRMEIEHRKVYLHHFPYRGFGDHTEGEERYSEHRLVNNGHWLLHGHVHTAWKVKEKCINVGVDVWNYKPVSIDEIAKLIESETHPLHKPLSIDNIALVKDQI